MATVAEIFQNDGVRPRAGERQGSARRGSAKHERVFGHYIGGAWTEPGEDVRRHQSGDEQDRSRASPTAPKADVDAAVAAARARLPAWKALVGARARAAPLRARARRSKTFAPARRAREHGQRQVDSRDARHRRAARRTALLSSRRLGAAPRHRVRRLRGDRRRRADHSVELPAAHARVEDRAGVSGR